MSQTATHDVELNFFYMHYQDAKQLAEWANGEKSKLRSIHARHAILATVFAAEALINRVIGQLYLLGSGQKLIERLGVREKWFAAPLICGVGSPSGKTLDASAEPFQSFAELIDIRNSLVHAKTGRFVEARADGSTITIMETGVEVPWVDALQGPTWKQTRIPVNPFEWTGVHATKALGVVDAMVSELQKCFPAVITDAWLEEIELRVKQDLSSHTITIDSLWGGYSPK